VEFENKQSEETEDHDTRTMSNAKMKLIKICSPFM